MKDTEYQRYVERFLNGYEVVNVETYPNLVRVDLIPEQGHGWQKCTFIFTEKYIACFGDVSSFTWRTTWNAAEAIKKGCCNAKEFSYLAEKLEHSHDLKEFEFSDEVMDSIKSYLIEGLDEDELKEFNEKWEENYELIGYVDKYRINSLDDFFEAMEVDDYYEFYSWFEHLPAHYYLAVAMLRCIEDYFSKKEAK